MTPLPGEDPDVTFDIPSGEVHLTRRKQHQRYTQIRRTGRFGWTLGPDNLLTRKIEDHLTTDLAGSVAAQLVGRASLTWERAPDVKILHAADDVESLQPTPDVEEAAEEMADAFRAEVNPEVVTEEARERLDGPFLYRSAYAVHIGRETEDAPCQPEYRAHDKLTGLLAVSDEIRASSAAPDSKNMVELPDTKRWLHVLLWMAWEESDFPLDPWTYTDLEDRGLPSRDDDVRYYEFDAAGFAGAVAELIADSLPGTVAEEAAGQAVGRCRRAARMLAREVEPVLQEHEDPDSEVAELREAVGRLRRRLEKVGPDIFRSSASEEREADAEE
jgi:hypothetical protein